MQHKMNYDRRFVDELYDLRYEIGDSRNEEIDTTSIDMDSVYNEETERDLKI